MINWEEFRAETAAKVLAGMVADKCYRSDLKDGAEDQKIQARTIKRCAYTAVRYTDALINELKRNTNNSSKKNTNRS